MKKTTLCMMMGVAVLATSCLSEDHDLNPVQEQTQEKQVGQFRINLSADASFSAQTRALNEATYRNTNNYNVQLLSSAGAVLLEAKASELSANLPKTLEIGTYTVRAFYGTERNASRNDFRVEGSTTFDIKANENSQVNVNCLPTCGKVLVNFSDDMATYYNDYNVTFGGTTALGSETFAWAKDDADPWYILLGENGESLNYTINLTAKDSYLHVDANGNKTSAATATGTFTLQRNRAYKLTVKPNYTQTTEGGLSVTITIDESTNDKPITIEVPVNWI